MGVIDRVSLDGIVYDIIDANGRALIAYPESNSVASKDYSAGEYFILNNKLYAATVAIETGTVFDTQSNCRLSNCVMDEIASGGGGLPSGGSSGQVLAKTSSTDYDVGWVNQSGGNDLPSGGSTGQVLAKTSSTDYDVGWVNQNSNADLVYVTPEQYGAVGDGITDDTDALEDCIYYASTHHVAVRGYGQYKTTAGLDINTSYLDLFINEIQYTDESIAVTITGSYNNIRFSKLYCPNGWGICLHREANNNCYRNKISAMRVYAKNDAVLFSDGLIIYNTFDIRDIKSDYGDCYHGGDGTQENVFLNSSCDCQRGWAIYNCQGRFYNFTLESNVLNGIYATRTGSSYFAGFRIRELVDKLVRQINGQEPLANGGTLIKYVGDCGYTKFVCEDPIPYEAIDVSEMLSPESASAAYAEATTAEERTAIIDSMARLAWYHEIDAPIRYGNWSTTNGYYVVGRKMIVQSGRKFCIPYQQVEYTITDSDYDMRDIMVTANSAKIYPTKFIIGVDSCVIHLPSSYSSVGYSEFIVDQRNHTCTIYDHNDSTTPIFNGATRGAGIYRFKAYSDLDNDIVHKTNSSYHLHFFDGSNYTWKIERIDVSGGSVNLNYVTPETYGAVGDGVTDDSQAVQDACDAGYSVYFDSNKTYYLASTVTINHDCHLFGGKNAKIKTKTPSGGTAPNGIIINGTLKKTTTLTSNYSAQGSATNNAGNRFELTDMTGIEIGDIMHIVATDQYYNYNRQYYYIGGTLMIADKDSSYLYTSDALPFDIENTNNVTVKVYSASTAIIENLNFESDLDTNGSYHYLLTLNQCKNSAIRNVNMTNMDNGLLLWQCVNTSVDCMNLSMTPPQMVGSSEHDHYGFAVYMCTNTVISRVQGECANSCIDLSGETISMNTYIKHCNLFSQNRVPGLGLHECVYNTIVEDCVLSGVSANGTIIIKNCRFVNQNKKPNNDVAISYHGNHDTRFSRITVEDCVFEDDNTLISLDSPYMQNPVRSYDHVIGEVNIIRCVGGRFYSDMTIDSYVLSNTIERFNIDDWQNCYELYFTSNAIINSFSIKDSTFTVSYWINSHNSRFFNDYIRFLSITSTCPQTNRIYVSEVHGGAYYLPENTDVAFTSSDTSAHYVVCGKNVMSNSVSDYSVGNVSGSTGGSITRTVDSNFSSALSVNSSGEIVLTQPNLTTAPAVYPKCFVYAKDKCVAKLSCKLKNTGTTNGSSFRAYIAVVDASTGKITYKNNGDSAEATSSGAVVTHTREIPANSYVLFYFYCYNAIANSETTFSELTAELMSYNFLSDLKYEPYTGSSRTGDGVLQSVGGLNNIMADSTSDVAIKFKADLLTTL